MPESEPKPKLIELVAPGAGQGWKAVLRNGKAVVVHEIPVPPAEAQAAAPRLQRIYDHRHPALSPVLAWGTDQTGVWVAVEPNEGTPLGSILSRGPLTPPAAAALGAEVLSGVAALHEAGIAMGGFGAQAVRVTSNGEVRLAGHPAAAVRGAPSQSDLRADVRSCGMAVCAAFGVDPAGAPAPPNIPPGLVVTMRSMASGAMGPSADRAQAALREMAQALLAPDRQMAAQSELATRSGGREVPKITPFLPGEEQKPLPPTVPLPPAPAPAAPASVAPAAAAPTWTTPSTREETAARRPASYDAPDRPLQTYPSMPAYTFPPAPAAPAASAAPAAPVEPKTSSPAVPTWSEGAPATEAPYKPAAPAPEAPKAPVSPFENIPPPAPAPAPAFATAPPAAPAPAPAPAPVEPAKETWTPVEAPKWSPGKAAPFETLGTGDALPALAVTPEVKEPAVAAAPAAAPTPVAPAPAPPVRRPSVPRPPSRGGGPTFERPPWLVPAAVAAIIVILLGAVGVKVLTSRGTSGGGNPVAQTSPSAHPTGSPKGSPSSSPSSKTPQAVPTYAPASAETVSKVVICTSATPCHLGSGIPDETATACELNSCTVEVAIYFTSVQKSLSYSYNLKFFDRCSGQTTDLPGPQGATPASGYIVGIPSDHWKVSLPSGVKSGALVAVSQTPAVAASAPLLLGSQDSCA